MNDIDDIQRCILVKLSSAGGKAVEFNVKDKQIDATPALISEALRALLESGRISLRQGDEEGSLFYLSLANGLTESALHVLDVIGASGQSGIDQAQLISQTRLNKSEVIKALHTLLENKHIQERRSFANRAKRIYLLYILEPSSQITGGTFYCGEELDVGFVDELRRRIVSFVMERERAYQISLMQEHSKRSKNILNNGDNDNNNNKKTDNNTRIVDILTREIYEHENMNDVNHADRSNATWIGVQLEELVEFVKSQCSESATGNSRPNLSSKYDFSDYTSKNTSSSPRVSSPVSVITSQHYDNESEKTQLHTQESKSAYFSNPAWNVENNGQSVLPISSLVSSPSHSPLLSHQTFPHKQISERDVMRLLNVLILDGVLEENVHVQFTHCSQTNAMESVNTRPRGKRARSTEFDVNSDNNYDIVNNHHDYHNINNNNNSNNNINFNRNYRFQYCNEEHLKRHVVNNAMPHLFYTLASQAHNVMRHFTTQRATHVTSNSARNKRNITAVNEKCEVSSEMEPLLEVLRTSSTWKPAAISTSRGNLAQAYVPAVGFPCMGCPLLTSCMTNGKGIVNPYNCEYLREWLNERDQWETSRFLFR